MKPIKKTQLIKEEFKKTRIGGRLADKAVRTVTTTALSLGWNLLYAIFNCVLGILYGSVWFFALFLYYLILGLMRLSVMSFDRNKNDGRSPKTVMITLGVTLIALALSLTGIIYLRIGDQRQSNYGNILMISIATLTTVTVVVTIRNTILAHKKRSDTLIMLRNISCAGTVGSILSMEHAMLSTFGELSDRSSFLMEVLSGAGAFLIITSLGIAMIVRAVKRT